MRRVVLGSDVPDDWRPMAEAGAGDATGALILVGTPIGNLQDVTPRALQALRLADVICAEDTRRSRKLLAAHGIRPGRLHSVRAHNEQEMAGRIVQWVSEGRVVAYVTDAGMPCLSDPGERLVREVLAAGGTVSVAAGPDAATTALLVSGLPQRRWAFEGFLPTRGASRRQRLGALADEPRPVVLFEAPHRLRRTLADLAASVEADRQVAVCNDLTKLYERTWRGTVRQMIVQFEAIEPQGEFVIVVAPPGWQRSTCGRDYLDG